MQPVCHKCDKTCPEGSLFCPQCGSQLEDDATLGHFISVPTRHASEPPELQIGKPVLKRFLPRRLLGKGRFASVYLAHDEYLREDVAIKVIRRLNDLSDPAQQHLASHVSNLRLIGDQTHILRVHDLHSGEHDGIPIALLSMEYADGGTLRDWLNENIKKQKARETDGVKYLIEALEGLQEAFKAGVIHLDLKPENLVFVDGVLKVTDFGFSTILRDSIGNSTITETVSGPTFGTPPYACPEARGNRSAGSLDTRADIYSLGVILYEILHPRCHLPHERDSEGTRRDSPIPTLPGASPQLARIVSRCLAKNPSNRYKTPRTLMAALSRREQNSASSPSVPPRQNQPDFGRIESAIQNNDFWSALVIGEEIQRRKPNHKGIQEFVRSLRARYDVAKRHLEYAAESIEKGDIKEAAEQALVAARTFPKHPDTGPILTRLAHRKEAYCEHVRQAVLAGKRGELESAKVHLCSALRMNVNEPALLKAALNLKECLDELDAGSANPPHNLLSLEDQRNRRSGL